MRFIGENLEKNYHSPTKQEIKKALRIREIESLGTKGRNQTLKIAEDVRPHFDEEILIG